MNKRRFDRTPSGHIYALGDTHDCGVPDCPANKPPTGFAFLVPAALTQARMANQIMEKLAGDDRQHSPPTRRGLTGLSSHLAAVIDMLEEMAKTLKENDNG